MQKNHNITLLTLLLICLFSIAVKAQYPTVRERLINLPNFDKKTIHFGYLIGLNQYDYKFEYIKPYYKELMYKDIETIISNGFCVGLIGDLRINEFMNLRFEPSLFYNKRSLLYPEYPEFTKESDRERELKSTNIHLPLLFKVSTRRINNFRPFLLAGFSADFNLSSNFKNTDDNASAVFRTVPQNFNYELGLGFEFYLYYFKFSPSLRGVFSVQNELIPDTDPQSPWTDKIVNMFSRGVALIITFE